MRLRDRPLKLLTLVMLGTVALILFGADLLDGEVTMRKYGQVAVWDNPVSFLLLLLGYLLALVFITFGWITVRSEWSMDYRFPPKPRFDDQERRRPH